MGWRPGSILAKWGREIGKGLGTVETSASKAKRGLYAGAGGRARGAIEKGTAERKRAIASAYRQAIAGAAARGAAGGFYAPGATARFAGREAGQRLAPAIGAAEAEEKRLKVEAAARRREEKRARRMGFLNLIMGLPGLIGGAGAAGGQLARGIATRRVGRGTATPGQRELVFGQSPYYSAQGAAPTGRYSQRNPYIRGAYS